MEQLQFISILLPIIIGCAIPTNAVCPKCKAPAAPACIFNTSSQLFTLSCASEIEEHDAYQPKRGQSCKWIGYRRVCTPYTATTGNCQYVVDSSCKIVKSTVCTSAELCKTATCSWPGNPKNCKLQSCRFKGGCCKISFNRKGSTCYDDAVMRGKPCLKGVCNGKGRCDAVGRDKEDCTVDSDISTCVKRTCSNDTCVPGTAPTGTKCAEYFPRRSFGCRTTCCDRFYACDSHGVCDRTGSGAFPVAGTPCVQTPTPCLKGVCDGHGACADTTEIAPPGWPCQNLNLTFDELCASTKCDAGGECTVANDRDGSICDFWKPIPDFTQILPQDVVLPRPTPPGTPPPPPFVPPNVTGSCEGYCYQGVCENTITSNPCFPCFSPMGSCEDDPAAPCSCYRGDCYRDCPT